MIQKGHKRASRSITILSELRLTLNVFTWAYVPRSTYGSNRKPSLFLISTIFSLVQRSDFVSTNTELRLRMSLKAKKLQ